MEGTTEQILENQGWVLHPGRAWLLQLCSILAAPSGLPVLPAGLPTAWDTPWGPTAWSYLRWEGLRRKFCPLGRANQTIPAGLRHKEFHWESQAAKLGNNVSALNLIYLLISQTTCFFYCIYFKHSFKLCVIFQSF